MDVNNVLELLSPHFLCSLSVRVPAIYAGPASLHRAQAVTVTDTSEFCNLQSVWSLQHTATIHRPNMNNIKYILLGTQMHFHKHNIKVLNYRNYEISLKKSFTIRIFCF